MPVIANIAQAPFDSVEDALILARIRLNDAMKSLDGEVFTDLSEFTKPVTNIAWRNTQRFLGDLGLTTLIGETIITGVPSVTSLDPASRCFINWVQFFDGNNYTDSTTGPVLPQNLLVPLKVWERWSGQNAAFCNLMVNALDGIPDLAKCSFNRVWEWRENSIFFVGSQQIMDLRIRYIKNLGDFETVNITDWTAQPIPIYDCLDALANYMCAEVAAPRGDVDADNFIAKAERACRLIVDRETRMTQRVTAQRIPRSGRASRGSSDY